MSRPAPLFRSTSWADVEDEEQAKLQRQQLAEPKTEQPSAHVISGTKQGKGVPGPVDNRAAFVRDREQQAKHLNDGGSRLQNGRGGGKLWEPSNSTNGKPLPKDGQGETWRRGETLGPQNNGRKPAKDQGDKSKQQKKRNGSGRTKTKAASDKPTFEICIRPVPSTLTREEAQKAFEGESIVKMKLLKDRAFIHFASREAQEKALKATLPRWGDLHPRASIPPPKEARKDEAPLKAQDKKPVETERKDVPKKPAIVSSTAQPKKGKAEEKKVANIFAALDSEEEEEELSLNDSEEEADEEEEEEENDNVEKNGSEEDEEDNE